MRKIAAFNIFLAAALLASIPAAAKEVVRSFHQQLPIGSADRIHLDFPVGEVQVEGRDFVGDAPVDVEVNAEHVRLFAAVDGEHAVRGNLAHRLFETGIRIELFALRDADTTRDELVLGRDDVKRLRFL